MDERQTEIKVGAGLDESRLNQDLIEFLKKWSTPILLVILAAALVMFGLRKWHEYQDVKLDQAFVQLDQAEVSGKPENLLRVAQEHAGQRAIPHLASLMAADSFLKAARTRVAPGFELNLDGTPKEAEAILSEAQRTEYLDKAATAYQSVYDQTKSKPEMALHTINALFGIAAVAESKGDFEAATRAYTDISVRATAAGMPTLGKLADDRRATVTELQTTPRLYTIAELPAVAAPAPAPAAGGPTLQTSDGGSIQMVPMEGPPPGYENFNPAQPGATPQPPQPVGPQPEPAPAEPDPGSEEPEPADPQPATPPADPPADPK